MRRINLFIVVGLMVSLSGCSDRGPVKRSWGRMKGLEKIVGNPEDVSYSQTRGGPPRFNARGEPVQFSDFEGEFMWVEYVASWCKVCSWQTPQTQKVRKELENDMVFLTVMTSKSTNYNDHATVDTARTWAGQYNLDPKRVIAAELWFKTIPEHRLFSPEGHTLFVHVGALKAQQIRKVINYYKNEYASWPDQANSKL